MKAYIGIDPGKTGGYAIYYPEINSFEAYEFDSFLDVSQTLRDLEKDNKIMLIFLEQVHAMPGQGVSSMFNFGANYGGWLALLEIEQRSYIQATPQKWQKTILGSFGKGESKARALAFMQRLAPKHNFKKKDSGKVDACCMALYCYRVSNMGINEAEEDKGKSC